MIKNDFKKILILFKREFQLNKKLLLIFSLMILIVLAVVFNLNFSKEYERYVVVIVVLFSFLLSSILFIPTFRTQSEKGGILKTLKIFPINNTHIFLSKFIHLFFFTVILYLIPIFFFSTIYNFPEKFNQFLTLRTFNIYVYGIFFIFFSLGVFNLVLSFINNKILKTIVYITILAIPLSGIIPAINEMLDNIDNKIFREPFMINGFLYFSILMFCLVIPLVYIGIKIVNGKKSYQMYE
jgi:hypothetical protein